MSSLNQSNARFKNGQEIIQKIFASVRKTQVKADKPKKDVKVEGNSKRTQTISELYKDINLKSHLIKVYVEVMQCPMGKPPDRINSKDFIVFVKHLVPDIYENDAKDAFYYLARSKVSEKVEEEKLYLQPDELGKRYDEYVAKEENLKGVLSTNTLKKRIYELHQKVTEWNKKLPQQKELQERYKEKSEYILTKLKELADITMLEKNEMNNRINEFYNFLEKKHKLSWKSKVIVKFLFTIPANTLSLKDLKRHFENEAIRKLAEFSLLKSFIAQIKRHCTIDGNSFSFYDIPDAILSMKYGQTEYNLVINFIKKAKNIFLNTKKTSNQPSQLTDDDMVPITILDETFTRMRHYQEEREHCINRLIAECEAETETKIADLTVTKERVMETIESNITIGYLNSQLDDLRVNINLHLFIIRQLYSWLSGKTFEFKGAEFFPKFDKLINTSKESPEFIKANSIDSERISEKETSKSKMESTELIREVEEAIDVLNDPTGKFGIKELTDRKTSELPLNIVGEQFIEDDKRSPHEEQDAKNEGEYFRASNGEKYNPKAKFGILEKDFTEYDPHMTKYEAVLPENFYMDTVNKQNPEKKDKWFIRPHHVETLTRHPYSKWDDILNTKYYSYYHGEKKKQQNTDKHDKMNSLASDVIDSLEEQIIKLKARLYLDEQLKEYKKELGMSGKSLSLKSHKDKNVLGKVEKSVEEIRR